MRASSFALLLLLPSCATSLRAAVIGGGLGGLTCCNALRKVGIDAQVFERAKVLSPQAGTGLTLWPNGLSALQAIDEGLLAPILEEGSKTLELEVTSADGLTKLPNPTGDPKRFPSTYGHPMINIHWARLQSVLASRLPGESMHFDRSFVGLERDASGKVTLEFADASGKAQHAFADVQVI